MTTITKARAALPSFTGKGKAARELAFVQIAPAARTAETGRGALLAHIGKAAGNAPDSVLLDSLRRETIIGFVSVSLPAGERPKGCTDDADQLEFARDLVCNYVEAPKEGAKASKLKAGKKGYRSAVQQRVIGAAKVRVSRLFADAGIGAAQTTAQRVEAAKTGRDATKAGQGKAKGADKSATPNASELVKAPITTRDQAHEALNQCAATAAAIAKKYAKLLSIDAATAAGAFRTAMLKAMNDEQTRKATADAKAAENEK